MNTDQCPGANVCCNPSWCKTTGKCLHQQPGQQPRSAVDRTLDYGGVLMNRDEIIRMALTAQWWGMDVAALERFAALVAAAEREACAKVCEERSLANVRLGTMAHPVAHEMIAARDAEAQCCAAAIRARGKA